MPTTTEKRATKKVAEPAVAPSKRHIPKPPPVTERRTKAVAKPAPTKPATKKVAKPVVTEKVVTTKPTAAVKTPVAKKVAGTSRPAETRNAKAATVKPSKKMTPVAKAVKADKVIGALKRNLFDTIDFLDENGPELAADIREMLQDRDAFGKAGSKCKGGAPGKVRDDAQLFIVRKGITRLMPKEGGLSPELAGKRFTIKQGELVLGQTEPQNTEHPGNIANGVTLFNTNLTELVSATFDSKAVKGLELIHVPETDAEFNAVIIRLGEELGLTLA